MWKRMTSFLIEFAETMLRVSNQGDRRTASELINLLTDISFNTNDFKRFIKSLADREDISAGRKNEIMLNDGVYIALVKGDSAKKHSHSTRYVKDVTEVL